MKIKLTLPWPPSANRYWRRSGSRIYLAKDGRQFREQVNAAWIDQGAPVAPRTRLKVQLEAFPPDRRRRDIDNLNKATWDAVEHVGCIWDDALIDDLHVIRREVQKPGHIVVTIEEADHARQG